MGRPGSLGMEQPRHRTAGTTTSEGKTRQPASVDDDRTRGRNDGRGSADFKKNAPLPTPTEPLPVYRGCWMQKDLWVWHNSSERGGQGIDSITTFGAHMSAIFAAAFLFDMQTLMRIGVESRLALGLPRGCLPRG